MQQIRMNETIHEAISDDIKVLGGPKAAAAIFFVAKTPDRAADTLRAWCNPSRAEEPSADELFLLIDKARQRVGFSEVARYIEHRLNCRMEFLSPEDERARLQRQFVDAVATVQSLVKRLEVNDSRG
jgi:hypothetical protein